MPLPIIQIPIILSTVPLPIKLDRVGLNKTTGKNTDAKQILSDAQDDHENCHMETDPFLEEGPTHWKEIWEKQRRQNKSE